MSETVSSPTYSTDPSTESRHRDRDLAPVRDRVADALEPVAAELRRRGDADTARILAAAREDARAEVERAEREAAAIIERARIDGVARALAHMTEAERRARREARTSVLAAQQVAYDRWRRESIAAVLRLSTEPGFAGLSDRLRDRAVRLLGTSVRITADATGGLVAEAGGRRLDYRLTTIAAQALDGVEPDIDGLWS